MRFCDAHWPNVDAINDMWKETKSIRDSIEYSDLIGPIGGFTLLDGTEMQLTRDSITDPVPVDVYSDVQRTFLTEIELPGIPLGTPYGWSSYDMCWYYFTPGQIYRAEWTEVITCLC